MCDISWNAEELPVTQTQFDNGHRYPKPGVCNISCPQTAGHLGSLPESWQITKLRRQIVPEWYGKVVGLLAMVSMLAGVAWGQSSGRFPSIVAQSTKTNSGIASTQEMGVPWRSKSGETTLFLPLGSAAQWSTVPYRIELPQYNHDQLSNTFPGHLAAKRQQVASPEANSDLLAPQKELAGDDILSTLQSMGPTSKPQSSAQTDGNLPGASHGSDGATRAGIAPGEDPHAAVFIESMYPSAIKCGKCHQKIYDEWRVSAHAYASISPMFLKFEQTITQLSQGTVGTFCMRCHAPVATQMSYPREASLVDSEAVYREGITCVACHRVKERYGRVNGERRIEPGDIFQPVYGGIGGDGVARVIADADNFKIKLQPNDKRPGQELHQAGIQFEQLTQSSFCVSCHQVAVHPGIALEVVWAQYRASPAHKKGVTCQDCHMGLVPGKASGYAIGPAAEISGKTINSHRKHSNHAFYGPGMPIAHPGIFPHNEKALRWKLEQWLEFDWRGNWGTPDFEKLIASGTMQAAFPQAWSSSDERRDARKVVDDNLKAIELKRTLAIATMSSAARIDGPFFRSGRLRGQDLAFEYNVQNTSDGHNMPSGSLGAQPQLWLNVVLTGPDGRWLWESGYLDANGDLADNNSALVSGGTIPRDRSLVNLQTRFLITGVKGTERELSLPLNVDIDQLPFLRPGALPITVLNHPPLIRMEAHSVPPLGNRVAKYRVPGNLLQLPGVYRLSVRMRSRMEPIYFMRFCNSTPEMERRMLEQTLDIAPHSVEFQVP